MCCSSFSGRLITWAPPPAIIYGTALSATQLDATASVPGTFVYSPATGTVLTVGQQTLSVTFTPTNTTEYSTATDSVILTVNQATVQITASSPTVSYGSAVPTITPSFSAFQNGQTSSVLTTSRPAPRPTRSPAMPVRTPREAARALRRLTTPLLTSAGR